MEIRRVFTTIDTHTAGGPTRMITSGLPRLLGKTVAEKMTYLKEHNDSVRKLLLNEPRGHKDMYGAVITEPTDPEADLGMFFMTASGYLPTCVHSSIGAITALLETGALEHTKSPGVITVETPTGLIAVQPIYQHERLVSIRLRTRPAFVYLSDAKIIALEKAFQASVVFSGVFFLLVEAKQNDLRLGTDQLPELIVLSKELLEAANQCLSITHPENTQIQGCSLVLFYERMGENQVKDIVIGRSGSVDRSPCGAGTGALAILEYSLGQLKLNQPLSVEGPIETRFQASVTQPVLVGAYQGAFTQIEGSAWVTGFHQFILEQTDPLLDGFIVS